MLRISACLALTFVFALCLPGCKDGDLETVLSHISGGASVTVDPVTGAITPGIAVNIKDSTGRTLYRAEAGVPVTRDQVRALVRRGAKSVTVAQIRYVTRSTDAYSPTQFSRYVVGDRIVEEDVCGTRSVTRAVALDDGVDLHVTPSMREQVRNIFMLRDRRYIRNSRPVERVFERAVCYAPAEVVTIPVVTTTTSTTQIPEPSAGPPAGVINEDKSLSLATRVDRMEDNMAKIMAKLGVK